MVLGLFFLGITFPGPSWARRKPTQDPFAASEVAEVISADKSAKDRFIAKNIEISEWFDNVAEGLDLFLIGRKVTKRKNETQVLLGSSVFVKEREGTETTAELDVNLRLPNVEDYWQLKFTSYDANQDRRIIQRGTFRRTPRQRNYGATLALFRNLGKVRTSFQPRAALQDGLKVSHSLVFESVAETDKYKLNPKLEFFANANEGAGTYLAINFHFNINDTFTLTPVNDAEYKDKLHTLVVTNGMVLGHKLTEFKSLAYNLFFESTNRDEYHLEGYTTSVTWAEVIYRNVLSYSISPSVSFAKPQSFVATPGIVFRVELQF